MRAIVIIALVSLGCSTASIRRRDTPPSLSANVRDYGALCDGSSDDHDALQRALSSGLTDVFVPCGVCRTSRSLQMLANTRLHGESQSCAVLQQSPDTALSSRLVLATDNDVVEDITLDGLKSKQSVDEHRAGLFGRKAAHLIVRRVTAQNFTGDGLYVYDLSDHVLIDNVTAIDNDRDGIVLGGGTTDTTIINSRFLGNRAQQIDSEGSTANAVRISGCVLQARDVVLGDTGLPISGNDYVLTISGYGATDDKRSRDWIVENNTINGAIFVVWSDKVVIRHNVGVNPTTKASVDAMREVRDLTISDNVFTTTQSYVRSMSVIKIQGTGPSSTPSAVKITHNTLTSHGYGPVFGVRVEGATSVEIVDNVITGPGIAAPSYAGVALRATIPTQDFVSAVVKDNVITDWGDLGLAVGGNGASRMLSLEIAYNTFGDTAGTQRTAVTLDDGLHAARDVQVVGNALAGGCTTWVRRAAPGAWQAYGDRWVMPN